MLQALSLLALLLPAQPGNHPGSPTKKASVYVPGHGSVMKDDSYVRLSKLLNVLFSMYVADPAVMRAWQQASGKG